MSEVITKKVFSLTINGLKEAIDASQALASQLDDLEKRIKRLDNTEIRIKLDAGGTEKVVVDSGSGGTGVSPADTAELQKQLAIKKQIEAAEKAQAQAAAATTKEWQDAYEAQQKAKQAVKEQKTDLDQLASGVKVMNEGAAQYANTMAGLKAELKNLNAERNNLNLSDDRDVQRFEEIQKRILQINTQLKAIETEGGVFSRNVGNYPQMLSSLTQELQKAESVAAQLREKLSGLKPGDEGYDKLTSELETAEKYASRLKTQIEETGSAIKSMPKIQVEVGGATREFNSMREAVKTLTADLNKLTLEGKENTQEFEDTIRALGRVKTAISQTSGEIKSYIGNAKGLADTVEIMQGISGIASLGQGINMLFGGQNKELDESLKKFAAITLIMQGLEGIQKSINDKTSIWGVLLSKANDWIDKGNGLLTGWIDKLTDVERRTSELNLDKLHRSYLSVNEEFQKLTDMSDGHNDKVKEIARSWDDAFRRMADAKEQLSQVEFGTDEFTDRAQAVEEATAKMEGYEAELRKAAAQGDQYAKKMLGVIESLKGIHKAAAAAGTDINTMGVSMNFMSRASAMAAVAVQKVTTAVKALGKATIILAVLQVAMEALSAVVDGVIAGVKAIGSWMGVSSDASIDAVGAVNKSIERQNELLQDNLALAERQTLAGTAAEKNAAKQNVYNDALSETVKEMQDLIKAGDQAESILDNMSSVTSWGAMSTNAPGSLSLYIEEWKILQQAVESGTDKTAAAETYLAENTDKLQQEWGESFEKMKSAVSDWSGWGWWQTVSDAQDDFAKSNKAVLRDFAFEFQNLDLDPSRPEQSIQQFQRLFEGEIGEMRQYALDHIEELFPDEPWAQMLNARYQQYKSFADSIKDLTAELAKQQAQSLIDLARIAKDAENQAIADQDQRASAVSKTAREREIQSVNNMAIDEGDPAAVEARNRAISAINAKYDREDADRAKAAAKRRASEAKSRLDKAKQAAQKLRQAEEQLQQNLLAIEKDGLDKRLKQFELSRQKELETARANGVMVKELEASINAKYDYQIAQAKEQWYRDRAEQQRKWNADWLSAQEEFARRAQELEEDMRMNDVQRSRDTGESRHTDAAASQTMNVAAVETPGEGAIKEYEKYYQSLLALNIAWLEEKKRLADEEAEITRQAAESQEAYDYRNERAALDTWLREQEEAQREAYDKGETDEETYNSNLEKIRQTYQSNMETAGRMHQQKLSEIQKNAETTRKLNEEQHLRDMKQANKEYIDQTVSMYSEMNSEIQDLRERQHKDATSSKWGIMNVAKERKSLQEAKSAYQANLAAIEKEYTELQRKLDANEITFSDFKEAKKELDGLKKATEDAAKEVQENLSGLTMAFAQNLAETITGYMDQLGSLASMWNDIVTMELDQQQAMLDEKQEMLEEEEEQLENHYQKQKDITDKYTDKINDIEGELKSARGSRRAALIADLQAEKEAQRASLEAEEEIQAEKDRNAQEQEQLKQQQDALDKKRKEQEKKMSIIQATINTATAVTNALSVQPWFVGVALAAVAAALGAVQIAKIKAAKYETGGVIDGPRHSKGGVKVPTTRGMAEVEGGEFIVNRKTTAANLSLLEGINGIRREITAEDLVKLTEGRHKAVNPHNLKFADGGEMPDLDVEGIREAMQQGSQEQDDRPIVVDVREVINKMESIREVRAVAGLSSNF